ncbi:hypothetical protein POM88_008462 [Heracleum sosnowskyi]|uniref:Uncharacterized protein n=1 Tax=Heracleum sosnowskyi TaxID=360622 RepID=A0AAD8N6J5_9APIA|nr:hypothetical protein POM88_008462 [Heracleum sosnowskyi]
MIDAMIRFHKGCKYFSRDTTSEVRILLILSTSAYGRWHCQLIPEVMDPNNMTTHSADKHLQHDALATGSLWSISLKTSIFNPKDEYEYIQKMLRRTSLPATVCGA